EPFEAAGEKIGLARAHFFSWEPERTSRKPFWAALAFSDLSRAIFGCCGFREALASFRRLPATEKFIHEPPAAAGASNGLPEASLEGQRGTFMPRWVSTRSRSRRRSGPARQAGSSRSASFHAVFCAGPSSSSHGLSSAKAAIFSTCTSRSKSSG